MSTNADENMEVKNGIHRLSTIKKSTLSDKIKRKFSQGVAMSVLFYGCTTQIFKKWQEKQKN